MLKEQEDLWRLNDLADPARYNESISNISLNKEMSLHDLETMIVIRKAEEKIGDMIIKGKIKCPCHLAIGQEAIPVGIARHLRKTDRVFGTHRSHGHYLSMKLSVHSLFAEILGKATGCAGGFGGSMHLVGQENGFFGSVPIVGATIAMAVGAGLAASMDRTTDLDVGVCYFGDGAAEEGCLHESLNLAAIYKLPVLFVCENNLFSSHLHIDLRQPKDNVARYAAAHNVNYRIVDGNNVEDVSKAAKELLTLSRNGGGPGFLEAVTYRWRGHVGPSEDNDVGLQRNETLKFWKGRDPVRRYYEGLLGSKFITENEYKNLNTKIDNMIEEAWLRAEKDPYPTADTLLAAVYKESQT